MFLRWIALQAGPMVTDAETSALRLQLQQAADRHAAEVRSHHPHAVAITPTLFSYFFLLFFLLTADAQNGRGAEATEDAEQAS